MTTLRLALGPHTLSWQVIALLAPIGVIAAIISEDSTTLLSRSAWLILGVLGQVAMSAILAGGMLVGAGRRRTTVVFTLVAASAARSMTIIALAAPLGVSDPLPAAQRFAVGTVTFTAWSILIGAAFQGWVDYKESLSSLLSRVDHTLNESQQFSQQWQARVQGTSTAPADMAATATALRADIAQRLRPLSHRLWFGITDAHTRTRLRDEVAATPLSIWPIVILSLILFVWNASYRFGFAVSLVTALTMAVASAAVMVIGEACARRSTHHMRTIRLATVVALCVIPFFVSWRILNGDDFTGAAVLSASYAITVAVVQMVVISTRQVLLTRRSLMARVEELESDRRAVAAHLHSSVQSRWTAVSLRLASAASSGDLGQRDLALAEARRLLESESASPGHGGDLEDLAAAWSGIAAVKLRVDAEIPPAAAGTLAHLVEEAVANAVRHGGARNIHVLVRVRDAEVQVVVTDDGCGVDEHATPGLGARWRDHVSDWTLTSAGEATRLHATIPLDPS